MHAFLQVLRIGRRRVEYLSKYFHISVAYKKKDEQSMLSLKISERILLAGGRYLKGSHAKIKENLKKRNAALSVTNFDKMVKDYAEYKACITTISDLRKKKRIFAREVWMSKKQNHEDGDAVSGSAISSSEDEGDKEDECDEEDEGGDPESSEFKKGEDIRNSIKETNERMEMLEEELVSLMMHIPNDTHPDVPVGDYSACRVVSTGGSKPEFSFPVLDHLELGEKHNVIDFKSASTISSRNFYYLKGAATMLEMALLQYAMQKAVSKGYHPVTTPDIIEEAAVTGCGFDPRDQSSPIYRLMGSTRNLCLSGTAEIPMAGMCIGESLSRKKLPMKFAGLGKCFRAESGGSGQHSKGLYRVHQFSKIELFAFTTSEESEEVLKEMVNMQKEIAEELGFHYRVLEMSSEELGASAYHKFDLEVWMPGRGEYGEVCSASNCTDYQSKRFHTRYRDPISKKKSKKKFVHTVNGTALAVPRMILSLLENYQKEDGSVEFPKVLHPFLPPDYWCLDTKQPRAQPSHKPDPQQSVISEPEQ